MLEFLKWLCGIRWAEPEWYHRVKVTPETCPELAQSVEVSFAPVPAEPCTCGANIPAGVTMLTHAVPKSYRPVCVRCLVPCLDLAETPSWSLVTVDELPTAFWFCPRCGLSKAFTREENEQRMLRCRKWVGMKLRTAVN